MDYSQSLYQEVIIISLAHKVRMNFLFLTWVLYLSVISTTYSFKASTFPGLIRSVKGSHKECITASCKMSAELRSTEPPAIPQLTNTGSKTSNLTKRWITGLSLGALCSGWIASGNSFFAIGFLVASFIMNDEYTKMAQATGSSPASRLGIVTSIICFLSAASFPFVHELVVPIYISALMSSFVLSNNKTHTKINEIAASVLGVIYTGYLPSFWVRLRGLTYPNYMELVNPTNAIWTMGASTTWWTWTSIVFAGRDSILRLITCAMN